MPNKYIYISGHNLGICFATSPWARLLPQSLTLVAVSQMKTSITRPRPSYHVCVQPSQQQQQHQHSCHPHQPPPPFILTLLETCSCRCSLLPPAVAQSSTSSVLLLPCSASLPTAAAPSAHLTASSNPPALLHSPTLRGGLGGKLVLKVKVNSYPLDLVFSLSYGRRRPGRGRRLAGEMNYGVWR